MKRFELLLTFVLTLAGCENDENQVIEGFASINRLQNAAAQSADDADFENMVPEALAETFSPIQIRFNEMHSRKSVNVNVLTLEATNVGEVDLEVVARISVTGMFGYGGDLELSKKNLKVGKSATWKIPVSTLPIVSDTVITQIAGGIEYRQLGSKGDGGAAATPMYYYINSQEQQDAEIFSEEVFYTKYSGRLKQKDFAKANGMLGKLRKADGTVETITPESDKPEILQDGEMQATVIEEFEEHPRYDDEKEAL